VLTGCFSSYPLGLTSLLDLEILLLSNRSKPVATGKADVNRNWLTDLPSSLFGLRSLERLEASRVGLRTLPDPVGGLARLRHLDLSGNLLGWLPPSFVQLRCLEFLDLSQNCLVMLPAGTGTNVRYRYYSTVHTQNVLRFSWFFAEHKVIIVIFRYRSLLNA
jgi:Leucine-rich repeat (LRR) protein